MSNYRIILAGQSNALPITDTFDVPNGYKGIVQAWTWCSYSPGVPAYRRSPWQGIRRPKGTNVNRNFAGVDMAIAKRLVDLGHSCHVIQCAQGGTTMATDWLPTTGPMYVTLLAEIAAATASTRCPANPGAANTIFVWIQGEGDCHLGGAAVTNWGTRFASLMTGVRGVVGAACKVVMVQLNSNYNNSGDNPTALRAVQATAAGADPHCAMVDPSSLSLLGDGAHYGQTNSLALGVLIADAALTIT